VLPLPRVVHKVAIAEGVVVRDGEKGHFDADEEVVEAYGDFGGVGVRSEAGDEFGGDEGGYEEGLPEGEEEDSFDAEEFRYGSVSFLSIK
jgi:hypothetical protein